MRRARKDINQLTDCNIGKACVPDDGDVLLDEEGASNSASPQVYVRPRILRDRELYHHVGEL